MTLGAEFVSVDRFFALQEGSPLGHALRTVALGDLVIPSGALEACDPFAMLGNGPVFEVPPGRYPVVVTIADVSDAQDRSHEREAYLSLVLAEGTPATVHELDPDRQSMLAFVGVDAGTVAFVDHDALETGMPDSDTWYDELFDSPDPSSWFSRMDDPDHLEDGLANIPLPLAQHGENLVLSHSGWGDGGYPVVATLDADGRMLAIHIDLLVATDLPEGDAG
jgi:hypothetical protein